VELLGEHLQLPPWLERSRCDIEQVLRPLQVLDPVEELAAT
jgi:hypothetical protein